jgi:hypothetical protein
MVPASAVLLLPANMLPSLCAVQPPFHGRQHPGDLEPILGGLGFKPLLRPCGSLGGATHRVLQLLGQGMPVLPAAAAPSAWARLRDMHSYACSLG